MTLVHPGRIDTPYNEHAQSYFEHQPTHRGMIYPPESVADAILFAAAHPTRDLFVGGQAKALAAAGVLAPSVVDKVMQRYLFWTEHDERPAIARKDSALHPPRRLNAGRITAGSANAASTWRQQRIWPCAASMAAPAAVTSASRDWCRTTIHGFIK